MRVLGGQISQARPGKGARKSGRGGHGALNDKGLPMMGKGQKKRGNGKGCEREGGQIPGKRGTGPSLGLYCR